MRLLFGDPIPPGYDRVTITTQIHQTGIPAAYLSPGVEKPGVMLAGPDGLQRPLLVEFAFLQCNRCGALLAQAVATGVRAHDDWHGDGDTAHAQAATVEPAPPV